MKKKIKYKNYIVILNKKDNSICLIREKLNNSPNIINGFKIWKRKKTFKSFWFEFKDNLKNM